MKFGRPLFVNLDSKQKRSFGNDLLSQGVAPQVPSALSSLTAGFGMGPGVTSTLKSPKDLKTNEVIRLLFAAPTDELPGLNHY